MIINRRKKFLINPKFQIQFIMFMVFIAIIAGASMYLSCLYFFWKLNELGESFAIPLDNPFFQFISQQQEMMNKIVLVTFVILFIIIMIFGLLYSHRICGPIYRIKEDIKNTPTLEECQKLKFRKNDFFTDLADEFNRMIERFKEKK